MTRRQAAEAREAARLIALRDSVTADAHHAARAGEAQRQCDHKFIDSTRCLKCGWAPGD